jgi:serine-type D-Ala-D-Ala carboxypeptidase/endopeptidase (penicillin-binding protein 4)
MPERIPEWRNRLTGGPRGGRVRRREGAAAGGGRGGRTAWLAAAALLLVIWPPAPLSAQLPRRTVTRIESLLDSPPYNRQLWGVALVNDQGKLLFGRNADKLFIPASNTKLVVTSVASALLPPDWTVNTSVYSAGPVDSGVVQGDLVLYGRGDPTMSKRCYSVDTTAEGVCDTDPFSKLRVLAGRLHDQGIRVVQGDLVGDGSYFDSQLVHPAWEGYDLNWWYAAPVSGLGFNDNSVDITWGPGIGINAPAELSITPRLGDLTMENRTRTVEIGGESDIGDRMYRIPGTLRLWAEGTVALDARGGTEYFAMPDPALFTARAFRQALAEAGISVLGTTRSTVDSAKYAAARGRSPLAEVASRPLSDWIFPILNTSQNWFADMLVKQLGRLFGKSGSWSEGITVERRFLIDSMGIDSTLFSLDDGSGLSAANLVAPLAFTQILRFIRRHPHNPTFLAGLPRSGQVGSLHNRFVGTPLEGRVQAKTGSISRVNTISGYIEQPSGKVLTFSVQANHHAQGYRQMLNQLDSIVVVMGTGAK